MRVLTLVGDLGPRHDVVAIMANRAHPIAYVGPTRMGVRHDGLDHPLNGGELYDPLAVIGLVPVLNKPGPTPQVVSPLTQSNV